VLDGFAQKGYTPNGSWSAEQKHLNRKHASSSVGARPSPAAPVQQNHLMNSGISAPSRCGR